METDHPLEIEAIPRHFNYTRPAKAVTDSAHTRGIQQRLFEKGLIGSAFSFAVKRAITFVNRDLLHVLGHALWMDILTVNIGSKGDIAKLCQHVRTHAGVIGEAAPIMNNQDTRPF